MEEKIIEAILKLFPFGAWLERLGCSPETSAGLSVLIVVGLIWAIWGMYRAAKWFFARLRN